MYTNFKLEMNSELYAFQMFAINIFNIGIFNSYNSVIKDNVIT